MSPNPRPDNRQLKRRTSFKDTAEGAAADAAHLVKLKRKLLAAAYAQHGVDLAALFARYDADHSGALSLIELAPHVQKLLPGALTHDQVRPRPARIRLLPASR